MKNILFTINYCKRCKYLVHNYIKTKTSVLLLRSPFYPQKILKFIQLME